MKITEITIQKINKSETKVLARVDIQFEEFLLKGFKVIQAEDTTKQFVTPPSYLSDKGWRPLFKTSDPSEWKKIVAAVLSRYNEHLMKQVTDQIQEP
ncbi:MAG: septation protein SpoVG family protein [Candidatus Gottesmanbacteria bacterium]